MRNQTDKMSQWTMVIGLIVILTLGGCAKRNVVATSSGAESTEASAKSKKALGSKAGGQDSGSDTFGSGGDTGSKSGFGLDNPLSRAETGMKAGGDSTKGGDSAKGGDPSGRVTESLGPIGTGPLQGFNKGAGEERLGDSGPLMIAKADSQDTELRKAREERRKELADIYFAFDKWVLSSDGKKNLVESAELLKQNPNAKVVIKDYCDERGSREYNLVLGEKRAKETRKFLGDLGINNPVSVTSFGKERQVCTERDESCYWKNRRAHLVLELGQ